MDGVLVKWLLLLHEPDEIVEIRSIDPKPVISGYFKAGSPAILSELAKYPNRTFYQTMNQVKPACYARMQNERLIERPQETTSDNDIRGYQWILVDADPVRPSGVSASKTEKEAARRIAASVMKKLMNMGFSEPIVCDSGNGYHLLFRVHAIKEDRQTIADFLTVLDQWFSTDEVKIDTAVFNPARITKLYGTTTHKGADTPERPHRASSVLRFPDKIQYTSMELVRNVASECHHSVDMETGTRRPEGFHLEQFLAEHNVQITKKVAISNGIKYLLSRCPFDSTHVNGDAAVFAYNHGGFGFHCFHNSCSGNHWHEFREKIDPTAYANTPFTVHQTEMRPRTDENLAPAVGTVQRKNGRMLDITAIPSYDRSKIVVIRSRFGSLDAKIGGFNQGEMSIWSGGNASGKSTLVGQLGLAAITEGFKVAMFSGEMSASRVREWMMLQAAGPRHVMQSPITVSHYCLKPGIEMKLDALLVGKLSIYDNDFGTDWEVVLNTIYAWVKKEKASVVIIDNLMALDLPMTTSDKYDMQSRIVKRFSAMAKELNVHIHFICHPRKTENFPRKGDISGTADITNVADNVFMVHRVNADFMNCYRAVYPKLQIPADVSTVVEVMKNRDLGVVDEIIMLYFDRASRTFSDIKGLPPQHAWTEKLEQIALDGYIPGNNAVLPEEGRC